MTVSPPQGKYPCRSSSRPRSEFAWLCEDYSQVDGGQACLAPVIRPETHLAFLASTDAPWTRHARDITLETHINMVLKRRPIDIIVFPIPPFCDAKNRT